jgi:1,4-alpha-glucan branching enzyme
MWEIFVPGLGEGRPTSTRSWARGELLPLKADPYGFAAELRPGHRIGDRHAARA